MLPGKRAGMGGCSLQRIGPAPATTCVFTALIHFLVHTLEREGATGVDGSTRRPICPPGSSQRCTRDAQTHIQGLIRADRQTGAASGGQR